MQTEWEGNSWLAKYRIADETEASAVLIVPLSTAKALCSVMFFFSLSFGLCKKENGFLVNREISVLWRAAHDVVSLQLSIKTQSNALGFNHQCIYSNS